MHCRRASFRYAGAVALTVALVSFAGICEPARAGGRARASASKKEVQTIANVIAAFWRCMRGKPCVVNGVFRGASIIADWRRYQRIISQFKWLKLVLIANTPAPWRKRYASRWATQIKKLIAARFRKRTLMRIGRGKSIVIVKPRVALAFTANTGRYRGRQATLYHFMVLWKVKQRWYLVFIDKSPESASKFMISKMPK